MYHLTVHKESALRKSQFNAKNFTQIFRIEPMTHQWTYEKQREPNIQAAET